MALPVEIRIVAAIAVAFIAPQISAYILSSAGVAAVTATTFFASTAGAIFTVAVGGALAGLITTGSFKGALIGGLTAAVFAGIGAHFNVLAKTNNFVNSGAAARGVSNIVNVLGNGLTRIQFAFKTIAHGIVGGLSSKLSGGSFSKSFLSTAVVQAFSPGIDRINSGGGAGAIQRVGAAAVLGGVASKLAGGSFSMGAKLGAFSRWFNDEVHGQGILNNEQSQTRRCSGWFGPDDPERDNVVGRDDTFVAPGGIISNTCETFVPACYRFGVHHDGSLDFMANTLGLPDLLANIPSMPFVYAFSVVAEVINTPAYIINGIFNTNITPPLQYDYPVRQESN